MKTEEMTLTEIEQKTENERIKKKHDDRFLQDFFVTKLLSEPKLKDYLCTLISRILNISLEEIEDSFELLSRNIGTSRENIDSEVDLLVKCKNFYVNIEANYNRGHSITDKKNFSYLTNIITKQLGLHDYSKILPVYQINLNNYDQFGMGELIYTSKMLDEKYLKERIDLLSIVDVDVALIKKMRYTGVIESGEYSVEWLNYIFATANRKNLRKVYNGNEMMERVMEKAFTLDSNIDWAFIYNQRDIDRGDFYEEGRADGIEEGRAIGQEEGREANRKEVIQKLNKKGYSIEEIHEMLEISIENIKKVLGNVEKVR